MSGLTEFVECLECGFVTYSTATSVPEPKQWDHCPDCGSTEFVFSEGKRRG